MVDIKHLAPSVEDYLKLRIDAGLSASPSKRLKEDYLMLVLMSLYIMIRH